MVRLGQEDLGLAELILVVGALEVAKAARSSSLAQAGAMRHSVELDLGAGVLEVAKFARSSSLAWSSTLTQAELHLGRPSWSPVECLGWSSGIMIYRP